MFNKKFARGLGGVVIGGFGGLLHALYIFASYNDFMSFLPILLWSTIGGVIVGYLVSQIFDKFELPQAVLTGAFPPFLWNGVILLFGTGVPLFAFLMGIFGGVVITSIVYLLISLISGGSKQYNWSSLSVYKKTITVTFILTILANSVMFMIPTQSQQTAIPFSSLTSVTIDPSTFDFPVNHFSYQLFFSLFVVAILSYSGVYLYKKGASNLVKSFGAVASVVVVLFLFFATPLSPFAGIPDTTSLKVHVQDKDTQMPIANSLCYLIVSNVDMDSQRTDASGNVFFENLEVGAIFEGGCYCPAEASIKTTFEGTTWLTLGVTAELDGCIPCSAGQMKCLNNNLHKCVGGTWELMESCASNEMCTCDSATNCYCKVEACYPDGLHCIDEFTRGVCTGGAWSFMEHCVAGCANGVCRTSCDEGWKCKDSLTLGYLHQDCDWSNLKSCAPGTCVTVTNAYCKYDTSTTSTLFTTTTVATTIPSCNYNGICDIGENQMNCPADCSPTTSTVTTTTTYTTTTYPTTTTIPPTPPQRDYIAYTLAVIAIIGLAILIAIEYKKQKKKGR